MSGAAEIGIDIDLEAEDAVGIRIDEDAGATVASLQIRNNAATARYDIMATADTEDMIDVTSDCTTGKVYDVTADSVTTGSGYDLSVDGLTTGKGIRVQNVGEAQTSGILIEGDLTASGSSIAVVTGNVAKFAQSLDETRSSGTTTSDNDVVLISKTAINTTASGTHASLGAALKIESTATETAGTLTEDSFAIEIATNARSSSASYAVSITHDNAGSGLAGGIDCSSFSLDEPILKFLTDTTGSSKSPETVSQDDWVCVENSAGTLHFLPAYLAS